MDLRLQGRTAFITGGTHGIGLAIGCALAAEGAAVSVCGRDPDRLKSAVAGLGEIGPPVHGVVADVLDPEALGQAVEEAAERLGGLDLVVANAGGTVGGDLLDSSPEDWAGTFALNAGHAAHLIRSAVPHFDRAGGGAALIISSVSGWKPGSRASYSAAKAAEIHLAAALAQELGPRGVRVNALSPGSVLFDGGRWGLTKDADPEGFAAFARENFPAGRLVTLDEIADTACFLLSERATGINGANICVDGGQLHPTDRRLYG